MTFYLPKVLIFHGYHYVLKSARLVCLLVAPRLPGDREDPRSSGCSVPSP